MPSAKIPDGTAPAAGTRQPNSIRLFHGTAALGGRTPHRLPCGAGAPLPGKTPTYSPCSRWSSPSSSWRSTRATPPPEDAGGGTGAGYVKNHLSEKLTLADVAAVFNFSPNYLSQLFGKYGDSGFVEYITETRIAAAKEMLEQGDLKVYEIAGETGVSRALLFSRYSKGHGAQPAGNTSKVFKIGLYDTGTACSSAGISSRLPALSLSKGTPHGGRAASGKERFCGRGKPRRKRPLRPCRSRSGWISPTLGAPHGETAYFFRRAWLYARW